MNHRGAFFRIGIHADKDTKMDTESTKEKSLKPLQFKAFRYRADRI